MKKIFLPITFLFVINLYAQDTIYVTADRIVSPLIASPADITIVHESELSKSSTIDEALENLTDTVITQSGPPGGNSSIFLRGTDSSHTLVVIDGIVMNDPSNPNRQFDLSKLSLNNIEKIEVLKGSQGLLYGSNAIGGVIVITTKKAEQGHKQSAHFEIGSHQTRKIDISAQSKLDQTGISLGADYLTSAGFSAANDRQITYADRDGIKRWGLDTQLSQQLGKNDILHIKYRHFNDNIELDKSGGDAGDDPNDRQKTKQHFFKTEYIHQWATAESKIFLHQAKHHRKLEILSDQYSAMASSTISKGEILNTGINHTQYFSENFTQFFTLDYQKEKDQNKHQLENYSFFTYGRLDLHKSSVTAGARLDINKIFEHHLTYKTSYLHKFSSFAARASLSTGYRSPSLNQLYDPVYGNQSLRPEKSFSREAGLESISEEHTWQCNLFWTDIRDRLSYHPVTFINQNKGNAMIIGLENNYRWKNNGPVSPAAALTFLSAKDKTLNQKLPRRPAFKGQIETDLKYKESDLKLAGFYQSKRTDVDNLGLPATLPAYIRFDFNLGYRIDHHTSAFFRVKNLLNKHYEEIYGYGNGGRTYTLGFESRY